MGKSALSQKRSSKNKPPKPSLASISPALIEQCELLRIYITNIGKTSLLKALETIEEKYFDSKISSIYGWDELTNGLGLLDDFLKDFGPHITKTYIARQFLKFREQIPQKVFKKHFRRMVITFYRIEEYACRKEFSRDFLQFFLVFFDLLDEL